MKSSKKKVVVLGAGVSGLSAAYRLSQDPEFEIHVVEKETTVGGTCRSFSEGDFILDYGPHKFYTLVDGILDELIKIMGEDLLIREKTQGLYMHDHFYSYPLKLTEMLTRFPPLKSAQMLLSYGLQFGKNILPHEKAKSYEQFVIERFGPGLYQEIFAPMAKKIYGSPGALDRKLAEVRISSPGLISVVKQLLFPSVDRNVSAPTFHYPKFGYGMIPLRLHEACEKRGVSFHLGERIEALEVAGNSITEVGLLNPKGERTKILCDHLIYTIPLSHLDNLIPKHLSVEVRKAIRFVNYRHTIIYYYLLHSEPVLPAMWVFFPEHKFRFGRLSEMPKFSPYTVPPGHTALMVDFTCDDSDAEWSMDDAALGERLLSDLEPLKLFKKRQIIKSFSKRIRNFYPVYSVGFEKPLGAIRSLEQSLKNILFIGRLGDFNYNNADQCLDMGFAAADHLLHSGADEAAWETLRQKRFASYKIVD